MLEDVRDALAMAVELKQAISPYDWVDELIIERKNEIDAARFDAIRRGL